MNSLFLWWGLSSSVAAALEGVVRERGTGDPVAEALVTIGSLSTTSDRRGRFEVEGLPEAGTILVQVQSEAYEALEAELSLPSEGLLVLHIARLPPPVEIVIEARVDSPHPSRQVLDRERVEKTPGTHDDPLRLIQSLPGVSMTPEYSPTAGSLSIRGALPGESRVLFDGVELPYLYHFQQYASVIHTRMLDRLSVYPSGFGVTYGESIGGVVAVSSRSPDPERVHGGMNINAIMAGGYVQAPAGDSGLSASGRRSFMDAFESGNDQYTLWPAFWDYLGRYEWSGPAGGRVAVTSIGAGDVYGRYAGDTEALDQVEQSENPEVVYDRGFHGLIAQHSLTRGRLATESVVGLVRDDWTVGLSTADQSRVEQALTLRNSSAITLWKEHSLHLGAETRLEWLDRQAATDRSWPELTLEAPLLARGVAVDERLSTALVGTWVEPRLVFGDLRLQPGLRLSGDTGTGEWVPEPRLIGRARLGDNWRLAGSAVRTSMAPPLGLLSPVTGNPELGRAISDQVSLGAEVVVAERWELGLEGWGRQITGAVDQASMSDSTLTPVAVEGWAAGVEITSRYRLRDRFFSWASVALGRAERDGHPMAYDQPYAFNLVFSWDVRPQWNIGIRYRYAAGLPLTPIVGGTYDGDLDRYLPIQGETLSARMADYQKLDLHLERDVVYRNWTLSFYLEAWWVPSSANGLYPVYSYDYSEQEMVVGPAFVPLVGARAKF